MTNWETGLIIGFAFVFLLLVSVAMNKLLNKERDMLEKLKNQNSEISCKRYKRKTIS